jgi:hypothetical protein
MSKLIKFAEVFPNRTDYWECLDWLPDAYQRYKTITGRKGLTFGIFLSELSKFAPDIPLETRLIESQIYTPRQNGVKADYIFVDDPII